METLSALMRLLPADLAAAILVVMHMPTAGTSALTRILARESPLPVDTAMEGALVEHGRVYVAPAGSHLVIEEGFIHLDDGPRENGHRPGVDPLFRTAAAAFGARVIGVVLSGMLDDGVAGLASIRARGGITVAQDPAQALFPGMPESAIGFGVDHILTVQGIAELIELAADGDELPPSLLPTLDVEDRLARELGLWRTGTESDAASGFSCPECGGSLWAAAEAGVERFRCHIGHAYSPESLLAAQSSRVEGALWSARASLEQRAALLLRLAGRMHERGQARLASRYEAEARVLNTNADTIRALAETYLVVAQTDAVESA